MFSPSTLDLTTGRGKSALRRRHETSSASPVYKKTLSANILLPRKVPSHQWQDRPLGKGFKSMPLPISNKSSSWITRKLSKSITMGILQSNSQKETQYRSQTPHSFLRTELISSTCRKALPHAPWQREVLPVHLCSTWKVFFIWKFLLSIISNSKTPFLLNIRYIYHPFLDFLERLTYHLPSSF